MSFQELINQNKPVLVNFSANWCGYCVKILPVLEELKNRVGDKANIIEIDIDKDSQVANTYNIRAVPTIIISKNGEIRWRQAGVFPANELERLIHESL